MLYKSCFFTTKLVGVNNRYCKKFVLTSVYRKCMDFLIIEFLVGFDLRNVGECSVMVFISKNQWRGDLDNALKVILDALEKSCVIDNDRRVEKLSIERVVGDKSFVRVIPSKVV